MFPPLKAYREFIYRVNELSPHIIRSTLVFYTIGKATAIVTGQIEFTGDIVLVVAEVLSFAPDHRRIIRYGYEVWRGSEKLYWYDSQPHPDDPTLAATHPHHKHVPPDIKHHRIPAPDLSFERPNLPFLIEEIERELLATDGE